MVGMHLARSYSRRSRVEPDHVLEVLPATEQPLPVGHLGVAADRTDGRVGEGLHQTTDGGSLEDGIAIDQNDDVAASVCDALVECGRFTGVGLPYQPYAGQVERGDDVRRPVGRPVIDHDDLHGQVVTREQRMYGGRDVGRLVVGGHHDGSGCSLTFSPITKKVAWAWCLASRSRICGVHCGSGPSSNVRAAMFAGTPRLVTPPAGSSHSTGPL
jgi:hypothetical protein